VLVLLLLLLLVLVLLVLVLLLLLLLLVLLLVAAAGHLPSAVCHRPARPQTATDRRARPGANHCYHCYRPPDGVPTEY
jgi:hypothetical protein